MYRLITDNIGLTQTSPIFTSSHYRLPK